MLCRSGKRTSVILFGLLLLAIALSFSNSGRAGNYPPSPYYSADTDKVFWFIQTSDTHVGASGTRDTVNLQWLVTQAVQTIEPNFIIVSGDLTDSTNGNFLGIPNGPYQAEWDQYKSIVDRADPAWKDFYFDIPGNHDAYNDADFSYYLHNSVQGRDKSSTQISFVKSFSFGNYHFLGINTADNTGAPFSLGWPYGDYAGLDFGELTFIGNEMALHPEADLTMVFGHHPLEATTNAQDTYVYYGKNEFLSLMDGNNAALYGYGHTHESGENVFVPEGSVKQGFFYFNIASLGKSSLDQYTIIAIDCNGISSKINTVGTWPAVLITAPVDLDLGGSYSYGYSIPAAASNPIRALVFDPNTPTVKYRINGGAQWFTMNKVASHLWQGTWDASSLPQGNYTIEVQATSTSGTSSDVITTSVIRSTPALQSTAVFTDLGKYVTTGSRKTKITTFVSGTVFNQGDGVVFRLLLKDSNNALIPGATVQVTITGPGSPVTLSGISNSSGQAELTWTTSAPNKRGSGGTQTGTYFANTSAVTASGYTWDGAVSAKEFTIIPR